MYLADRFLLHKLHIAEAFVLAGMFVWFPAAWHQQIPRFERISGIVRLHAVIFALAGVAVGSAPA